MSYIFFYLASIVKGYIGVNGSLLMVCEANQQYLQVWLGNANHIRMTEKKAFELLHFFQSILLEVCFHPNDDYFLLALKVGMVEGFPKTPSSVPQGALLLPTGEWW
jgi:hypothetical protein